MTSEQAFVQNNISPSHLYDVFKNVTELPDDLTIISGENERIPSNKYLLSIFSSTVRQVLSNYPYGVDPVILLPDYSSFSIKRLLSILNKGATEITVFNRGRFTEDCEEISGVAKVLEIDLSGVKFEYVDNNLISSPTETESVSVVKPEHTETGAIDKEVKVVHAGHKNTKDYAPEDKESGASVNDSPFPYSETDLTNVKNSMNNDLSSEPANNSDMTTATNVTDTKVINDKTEQHISSQLRSMQIFDCQICFQKLKHSCYHYLKNHYFDKIMQGSSVPQFGKVCPLCERQCNNKPMLIYHISSRHAEHINMLLLGDGLAPVQKAELEAMKKQISNTSNVPVTNPLTTLEGQNENYKAEISKELQHSQGDVDLKIPSYSKTDLDEIKAVTKTNLNEMTTVTKTDEEKINVTEEQSTSEMDTDKIDSSPKEDNNLNFQENIGQKQEEGIQNKRRESKRKLDQEAAPDRKLRPRVSEYQDLELNLAAMLEPQVLLDESKNETINYDDNDSENLLKENEKPKKIVRQNKPKRSLHSRSRSENPPRRTSFAKKDTVPRVKSETTTTPKRSSTRLLNKPKIQYNDDSKIDEPIEKSKSTTFVSSAAAQPRTRPLPSSPLMSNFTNWNNPSNQVKSEPRNRTGKKKTESCSTDNLQKILGNISVSVIRPGEINQNNVKSQLEKRLGGNISISSV